MEMEAKTKKITLKSILGLQGIVMIYTGSSIFAKLASGQEEIRGLLLYTGLEFVCLAVYALLWQQALKRFELSVAYANRAMVLLWTMLWAALVFHETVTVQNLLGVLLVIAGTFVINTEKEAPHAD